ncbi:hypothetical protein HGO38_14245 [Rhizobium sp. CG5]|uniref:hypothetical protein n=1 Tax=Rhizobium sp. CG5 TaxID=2726076 RepID=UPI002033F292|nr:hypothetical protein [Rhizobium sp. CG5]MCM2474638.1 hypothetical protein [Rhizobium sp. CG5]
MAHTISDLQTSERQQELLALINMMGYAVGIAETLGVTTAATHLNTARQTLVSELQGDLTNTLSMDGIKRLASARAGNC